MKTMKKLLAFLLVLIMISALTACGDAYEKTEKGKSRDAHNSSQQKDPHGDSVTTTPTAEPTNGLKVDPTVEPTVEPTAEPTPELTVSPTPTPTPPLTLPTDKELSYETVAGKWKMETSVSGSEYGAMISDEMEELFKRVETSNPNSRIKVSMQIEFKTDKTAALSARIDGSEFAETIKAMISTEDGILKFYSALTGMDIETLKGYLAMSGMAASDLIGSMGIEDFLDEMRLDEEEEVTYEIKGNTIYIDEDEEVVLVYDGTKDVLEFDIKSGDDGAFFYKGKYLTRIN